MVEFVQLAGAVDEISEVATTCFIITLVVRPPVASRLPSTLSRALQGLAIGFVLLRVEAAVEE